MGFILALCLFMFQGCDKQGFDDPTVFSGVILFSDTMEPAGNVEIRFVATKNDFPVDDSIEVINFRTPVDTQNGVFEARFEGGLGIDWISITVSVIREDGTQRSFVEPEDGLFCNGAPCFDFAPGVNYNNMTILVPRLEE
jgi:hypothetical protein